MHTHCMHACMHRHIYSYIAILLLYMLIQIWYLFKKLVSLVRLVFSRPMHTIIVYTLALLAWQLPCMQLQLYSYYNYREEIYNIAIMQLYICYIFKGIVMNITYELTILYLYYGLQLYYIANCYMPKLSNRTITSLVYGQGCNTYNMHSQEVFTPE